MKTTTMSSLTSVAPVFAESETLSVHPSLAKHRLRSIVLLLALIGGVALGSALVSQTPAIAREIAAARTSLRLAMPDAYNGNHGYGASAGYLPGRFSPEQGQQPLPPAWAWAQAGIRPL